MWTPPDCKRVLVDLGGFRANPLADQCIDLSLLKTLSAAIFLDFPHNGRQRGIAVRVRSTITTCELKLRRMKIVGGQLDHAKSPFEIGSSEARARHSYEPQGFFPLGSFRVPFCSAAGIPSRIPARLGLLGPAALIPTRFIIATPIVRFSHRPGLCQSTTAWGISVAPASLRALIRVFQFERPDWSQKPTQAACLTFVHHLSPPNPSQHFPDDLYRLPRKHPPHQRPRHHPSRPSQRHRNTVHKESPARGGASRR